jgi:hypothetical protein
MSARVGASVAQRRMAPPVRGRPRALDRHQVIPALTLEQLPPAALPLLRRARGAWGEGLEACAPRLVRPLPLHGPTMHACMHGGAPTAGSEPLSRKADRASSAPSART